MIGRLYRKELLAMRRDGRTVVLAIVLLALLAGSLLTALQQHDARTRELADVASATRQQWDMQGDKHPHRGAHFGLYAFQPESLLAALDPGLTRYTGSAIWLEPHRRNTARFEPAADALPAARFGFPDTAFVLGVLAPLLIVVLAHDAISRERESGSLRMLHGIGVSPWRLLSAKLCALLTLLVFIAVVPSLAAACAMIWSGSAATTTPEDVAWRAAALGAAHMAHLCLFGCLALAVSALCRTSKAALYVLIGCWLAATFVLPRAAAALANHVVPLPAAGAFWSAIHRDYREGLPGDGDLATRSRRFDEALLRKYGVTRLEDLPVGAAPLRRLERDAYADRIHARHFGALWDRYAAQERLLRIASIGSPSIAMRNLSMKLAGTDLSHRQHFESAAEQYRQAINTAIDRWDAGATRGVTSFESKYAGDALWRALPAFTYTSPTAGFALRSALPELAVLLGWSMAGFALLAGCTRRLRP